MRENPLRIAEESEDVGLVLAEDVDAEPAGGLLGSLLCAIANLLNTNGLLADIANLLNQILALL